MMGVSLVFLSGCYFWQEHHSEIGLRWGTEIAFFSRSASTANDGENPAYIEIGLFATKDEATMGPPEPEDGD
jgi:hypothetical protein